MDELPRLHAIMSVTGAAGTFDGHAMNTLIGVDGTVRRGGDLLATGGLRPDKWQLEANAVGVDWPALLDEVLAPALRHVDEFVEFCTVASLDMHVLLVAYMTGASPVGSFTVDQIRSLARLRCSVDIDLYCDPESEAVGAKPTRRTHSISAHMSGLGGRSGPPHALLPDMGRAS